MIAAQQMENSTTSTGPVHLGVTIDVGRDFSTTPGGRYKLHGNFSGEMFRSRLVPALREAIRQDYVLSVVLDNVKRSYLSSFLDEAFAGLVRDEGFSKAEVSSHLRLVATQARFAKYVALAEQYIEEA